MHVLHYVRVKSCLEAWTPILEIYLYIFQQTSPFDIDPSTKYVRLVPVLIDTLDYCICKFVEIPSRVFSNPSLPMYLSIFLSFERKHSNYLLGYVFSILGKLA